MKKIVVLIVAVILLLSSAVLAEEKKRVRVGVRPFSPPFCFFKDSGSKTQLRGIAVDLFSLIEKIVPYEFQYVACSDISQRREFLDQGNIDVLIFGRLAHDSDPRRLHIPVPFEIHRRLFVNESCKTIVCNDDLLNKKVAVILGDDFSPFIGNVKPEDLFVMRTPEEALKLLNNGHVDAFLAPSELTAMYIIQKESFEHILQVGLVLQKQTLSLELRADSVELHNHLAAAITKLDRDGIIEKIKNKWYGMALLTTGWKRYSQTILITSSAVFVVILVILFWNYHLKAQIRRVTKDLSSSELKYRSLIESSPDMIFMVDKNGQLRHANQEAKSILPRSADPRPTSIYVNSLVLTEERSSFTQFLETTFKNNSSIIREFRFVDPAGRVREMNVAATPISSENVEEPLVCCFARDVTERNRIERELVQADRLATIGQMAAGVAHEINNPIGIVQANIELILARGWYTEDSKEFLESIRRNVLRAGRITQDLLAVAKPKNPEMVEVDLYEIVQMTISMLAVQLKGIEVEHPPLPNRIRIWADSHLLQHVLVNVLLNAKEALKDRADRKIRFSYCTPSGETATCLRIEDNGKGIPREYLKDIFEPFFTYGKQGGFGLGLFISRRIIERHNGIMFAESETGKGVQISIELPLYDPLQTPASMS